MIEVLSLGGSLVFPEKIEIEYLKEFKKFLKNQLRKGKKFFVVVGGGKLAREYQKAAIELKKVKKEELDWLGIFATFLNAKLIQTLFLPFSQMLFSPKEKLSKKARIFVCGGLKPGHSTDLVAVLFAKKLKAKRVINLTNVDFVFDKDPKKFKDAKPLKNVSFKEYLKIVGKNWKPGASFPFDPKAAKLAQKLKIEVIILNGKNFKNLKNFLKGKNFVGTILK